MHTLMCALKYTLDGLLVQYRWTKMVITCQEQEPTVDREVLNNKNIS